MTSVTLKIQGMKAVTDPSRVMLALARSPIGGGTPEISIEVYKESPLGRLPLGAQVRARFDDPTTAHDRTEITRLVRFARSHADDDDHVTVRTSGKPEAEHYMAQLVAELEEGSLHRANECALKYAELTPEIPGLSADTYLLYVAVPVAYPAERAEDMAKRIQEAYDEGAASGWFQIIG